MSNLYMMREPLSPIVTFVGFLMLWDILFSPFGGIRRVTLPFNVVMMMFVWEALRSSIPTEMLGGVRQQPHRMRQNGRRPQNGYPPQNGAPPQDNQPPPNGHPDGMPPGFGRGQTQFRPQQNGPQQNGPQHGQRPLPPGVRPGPRGTAPRPGRRPPR